MPAWCSALLSLGAAWRTDGRMGTPGAETGAALGLEILLGCLAQLGQELGRKCSGTGFPLRGRRKKRLKEGWGCLVVTWGSHGAWSPI